jgi:UDP-N-acetyl-2-amino-2-deoxyglucuronate dehydrogenase
MITIKFGIIGYGHIGQRHAVHISKQSHAQLIGICDTKQLPQLPDGIINYKHYDAMLANPDIDVINVCTPNGLHALHTIQALHAGKHVVCEKPMALSVQECNTMMAAANANNKQIFVVKQNRYNPPVQAVKQLMINNTLGQIYSVVLNCYWNRNDAYYQQSPWRGTLALDGGCLYTQFSHFIDILYYLIGYCTPVASTMHNFNHPDIEIEDTGNCLLKNENGVLASINYTTCSHKQNMEGSITIIAQHGTVKIGGQYLNTIEYQNIHQHILPDINITAKNNNYGAYQGSMSNHDLVMANVVQTLNGQAVAMTNAEEGTEVVRMISEIYEANIR